ncbi:MAG TPA: hypothetical protein VEO01_23975, partial [Pseudonocardiaceae bacterium]|nr:hypothetical protein [Pseudonocardiaceae bacterium]
ANGGDSPAVADPMPPPADPAAAPPVVQQQYRALAKHLAGTVPILIGRSSPSCWVVGVDVDTRSLRLFFTRGKAGRWALRTQVVVDGQDRSDEAQGSLAAAVAAMAPRTVDGT